jgi:acyl-CoA thioester hydrolase
MGTCPLPRAPATPNHEAATVTGRPSPDRRDAYRAFYAITTRWMDNDAYGHVNNVVYYSFFDTAVNRYLIERCGLDIKASPVIGLVVETGCCYHSSLAYPDLVHAGIRVTKLGTSSVRYEVGLFRNEEESASAQGHFTHVYVDRSTNRPVPLPDAVRAGLSAIMAATPSEG